MKKIEIVLIDRENITVTNKDQQIPTTKTYKEENVKKEEIIELFPPNVSFFFLIPRKVSVNWNY